MSTTLRFFYTLTSLGMALYQVASVQDDRLIENLLSNFGIALLSTILGIFLRVMVSQIRRDPVEVEREARLELVEAASMLKGELRGIIVQLNDFRTEMTQILREGAELTLKQQGEALERYGETLGQEILSIAERVSVDLAVPLATGGQEIGRATEALRSRADEAGPAAVRICRRAEEGCRLVHQGAGRFRRGAPAHWPGASPMKPAACTPKRSTCPAPLSPSSRCCGPIWGGSATPWSSIPS